MRKLCPVFNTNRMVAQYVEEHYLPAAQRYRSLASDNLTRAKSLAGWEASIRTHWGYVRVEQTTVRATGAASSSRPACDWDRSSRRMSQPSCTCRLKTAANRRPSP